MLFKKSNLHPLRSAYNIILFFSCLIFSVIQIAGCTSQKDTVAGRGMQNLTARYNILYNAREILNESEQNIKIAYQDNYDVLLDVYEEPNEGISQSEQKNLDDAILKANSIVNDKSQSKYVDDAYFVIAKANFLKANFYNAAEFFTYIYSSYPKEPELRQISLVYKARSLMNSERFTEAEAVLDTALKNIGTEKKAMADVYASRAQLALYARKDAEAAEMLKKAIAFSKKGQNKIRWIFLLAQLQEMNGDTQSAVKNYTQVIKSNAPFEMAFNATLNRLSLRDQQEGRTVDRDEQLLSLLRNDNNLEFADQVYFQIAEIHAKKGETDIAVENYNTSIRNSICNDNQKGLSYLALADIYFKQADYVRSKAYYDSTLISLSPQYRDYDLIRKKGSSLELLSNRLSIISQEDTLQMLARLPEPERQRRIGVLVRKQAESAINPTSVNNPNLQQTTSQNKASDNFYFNNPIALSQGLAYFKRVWGNRKLEDNWRRSQRTAADLVATTNDNPNFVIPSNPDEAAVNPFTQGTSISTDLLPATPELLAQSNQRILSAYYDIGNYYREELNDEPEAIRTYELMLSRFPDSDLKLPLYYNLYRLYAIKDPQKSLEYKNILLNQYPESPFAKVIINPNYNRQTDEQQIELNKSYNELYDRYVNKQYTEVLNRTKFIEQKYGENNLSPQLAYLNALALGHTQKIKLLDSVFRDITNRFPEDKLIVPLVKQHLAFIDSNRMAMESREFALMDNDPNEAYFVEEPSNQPVISNEVKPAGEIIKPAEAPRTAKNEIPPTNSNEPPKNTNKNESAVAPTTEISLFSSESSSEYYFVVNVNDPSTNLNSSRFGIGQFNRANFSGGGIKHQLKSVNSQNQLIFVGPLSDDKSAADYYLKIKPLIKEIMKIPAEKYAVFYISKENLDKLADRETIDKYIQFYQQNISRDQ